MLMDVIDGYAQPAENQLNHQLNNNIMTDSIVCFPYLTDVSKNSNKVEICAKSIGAKNGDDPINIIRPVSDIL